MLKTILTGYIESALSQAEYDKLEDDTFLFNFGFIRTFWIRRGGTVRVWG